MELLYNDSIRLAVARYVLKNSNFLFQIQMQVFQTSFSHLILLIDCIIISLKFLFNCSDTEESELSDLEKDFPPKSSEGLNGNCIVNGDLRSCLSPDGKE